MAWDYDRNSLGHYFTRMLTFKRNKTDEPISVR